MPFGIVCCQYLHLHILYQVHSTYFHFLLMLLRLLLNSFWIIVLLYYLFEVLLAEKFKSNATKTVIVNVNFLSKLPFIQNFYKSHQWFHLLFFFLLVGLIYVLTTATFPCRDADRGFCGRGQVATWTQFLRRIFRQIFWLLGKEQMKILHTGNPNVWTP